MTFNEFAITGRRIVFVGSSLILVPVEAGIAVTFGPVAGMTSSRIVGVLLSGVNVTLNVSEGWMA
jgi:hypothetical protein